MFKLLIVVVCSLASEEEASESDNENFLKPVEPSPKEFITKSAPGDQEEGESDDSYDWGSDTDDEVSSSSDDEKYEGNLAMKFLKKASEKDADAEEEKRKRRERRTLRSKKKDEEEEDGGWETVKSGAPRLMEKPKMFAKDAEINHQLVVKKLNEILAARGKRSTDRTEQITMLNELKAISDANKLGPAMALKIMFAIVASIFDYNPKVSSCMKSEMWSKCLDSMEELLVMLLNSEDILIGENIPEDSECVHQPPYRVRGCVLAMVERLDEEFTKMLQGCDAHSTEYVERLKDEKRVCKIIKVLHDYLESPTSTSERRGLLSEICRIYLRRIEHIYYKFENQSKFDNPEKDSNAEKNLINEEKKEETATENGETIKMDPFLADHVDEKESNIVIMDRLCKFIYSNDKSDRIRTRAMLCQIYHHALHDNWFESRDLMLMSHLQYTIHHSDVLTQILYNRAMVQLGLCAFRHGYVKDAHSALLDIQCSGRAKELLAQGLLLQRQNERSSEQEKIEKRRQMPFHMHINLELLECVYLVSAMLLEIPYMSGYSQTCATRPNAHGAANDSHEFDARRRMISKSFHHQLKNSERQPLVGPPESMREHVVAASKAMRNGNWRMCKNFIINDKMNAKVWDLFHKAEQVRRLICQKIQEESLRTYLFTYSKGYDSISMVTLANMFELDISTVHSIISKMILNQELMASLEEPTQTVMMHRTEPSRLQSMALQLADKVSNIVENNEKIFEFKQGNYFTRGQGQHQHQHQHQQGYSKDYQQNRNQHQQGGYSKDYQQNRNQHQQGGYSKDYQQNRSWGGKLTAFH
ncbi:Eukaryotic translation initiation factor 3 subunit C [Nymphon striatum]|nr:Eukaryotic translation initiation factor 3 subunit C [Nymphon striatum]